MSTYRNAIVALFGICLLITTGVLSPSVYAEDSSDESRRYSEKDKYRKSEKYRKSDKEDRLTVSSRDASGLNVQPSQVVMSVGERVTLEINDAKGRVRTGLSEDGILDLSTREDTIRLTAQAAGSVILTISDRRRAVTVPVTVLGDDNPDDGDGVTGGTGDYSILAWNDLGMHCMDADYSVFSILPPYNNLHAQVIDRRSGEQVTTGITVTYQAMQDPNGSINSDSQDKTNFWDYVQQLFGVSPEPNMGLAGKPMASLSAVALDYHADSGEYVAEGIPITPYDDGLEKNYYPLVEVIASSTNGDVLASSRVVLPVSDEMTCVACHGSRLSGNAAEMAAQPDAGWVFDDNPEKDYRRNILLLHDENMAGNSRFTEALDAMGYESSGLLDTADSGTPILCAGCHLSNALPGTGLADIPPLTEAMHAGHGPVIDPLNGLTLEASDNRSACYQCHPGSDTRCLRGAMGAATELDGSLSMQCQSCHGQMSQVGAAGRVGWLEQPNCQACHHDGVREVSALNEMGAVKSFLETLDNRFASNPDTPIEGVSLFRMSKGHGDLNCESCHGATHAIYPSSHDNDNLLSMDLQGHVGTISECSVCHQQVPLTVNGGPHGMHTTGQIWVKEHHDYSERNEQQCAACHGSDFRGGVLSEVSQDRTFRIEDGGSKSYSAGEPVGCYDCHDGPYH